MSTAAFSKINQFILNLGEGVINLNTDDLRVYLSDTAPNVATSKVKADVPEIAIGNGYNGPISIGNSYSQAGGVGSLASVASISITAAGGSIGPFRYLVLYDNSVGSLPLIAFWDYGSELTLINGTTLPIVFGANVLQLS